MGAETFGAFNDTVPLECRATEEHQHVDSLTDTDAPATGDVEESSQWTLSTSTLKQWKQNSFPHHHHFFISWWCVYSCSTVRSDDPSSIDERQYGVKPNLKRWLAQPHDFVVVDVHLNSVCMSTDRFSWLDVNLFLWIVRVICNSVILRHFSPRARQ